MPLFHEIETLPQKTTPDGATTSEATTPGGQIVAIEPGSVAQQLGLQPGDELLAINDQAVEDVIDVRYYSAEEAFTLTVRRQEQVLIFQATRDYHQTLGLIFDHPTFDTDIRRCNNLCEFCFVLQMAPKFRRTLYVKDDDYRYSFLQGHFVTLTNLSDHDWWRIETMGLSPLYVSVHVTDHAKRRQFLRNATAPDIMPQLRWLAERNIDIHTQLVIVPEFNDGRWLERSIKELAELWPAVQSISVVPVGLTKQHKYKMRPHTQEEATTILDYIETVQKQYLAQWEERFVYATDEWYLITGREVPLLADYDGQALHENGLGMVRHFLDEWQDVQKEIQATPLEKIQFHTAVLATGTLFASLLETTAVALAQLTGVVLHVQPIINQRLGETITAAGLLMGSDILNQLQAIESTAESEIIILPRIVFDHPDRVSLDDFTPSDMARRLNRPVALADTMGDVWDALIGQSQVIYHPTSPETQIPLRTLNEQDLNSKNHIS